MSETHTRQSHRYKDYIDEDIFRMGLGPVKVHSGKCIKKEYSVVYKLSSTKQELCFASFHFQGTTNAEARIGDVAFAKNELGVAVAQNVAIDVEVVVGDGAVAHVAA